MMSEPDRDAVQVETQVDSTVLAPQTRTEVVRPLLIRNPFVLRRHAE